MTFEDHLEATKRGDLYDSAAAERSRREELEDSPSDDEQRMMAAKAAKAERAAYERTETAQLRKQFMHPALSPDLERDVKVPLGDNKRVRLGDMNDERIRQRKDLRTKSHLDENRAYDAEMTFWIQTENLLDPGQTVDDAS